MGSEQGGYWTIKKNTGRRLVLTKKNTLSLCVHVFLWQCPSQTNEPGICDSVLSSLSCLLSSVPWEKFQGRQYHLTLKSKTLLENVMCFVWN